MKSKLENFLHYSNNRRVVKIEYHSFSIDNKGKMKFSKIQLMTDADISVMWSTFYRKQLRSNQGGYNNYKIDQRYYEDVEMP